jgi:hypothetical protein
MAKASGMHQGLKGKIGGFIYYEINGVTYVRAAPEPKPKKDKLPPTPSQELQQTKFRLARHFLDPLRQLVYFSHQIGIRGARNGYHEASALLMNLAMVHHDTGLALAPNLALISSGNLTGAKAGAVSWKDDEHVEVTWKNNTGSGNAKGKDKALILLYNLEESTPIYIMEGAARSAEKQMLHIPDPDEHRGRLHAYLAFSSPKANGHSLSNSVYLGLI